MNSPKLLTGKRLTWLLIISAIILTLNALVVNNTLFVLLPLAKALALVFIMFMYGFLLMYFTSYKKGIPIEFTTAFALGLIVTTLFFYLVSWFKLLFPGVIILYYLLPLPIFLLVIKKKEPVLTHTLKAFFQRPALEYLVFLFPLLYASLPPSFYDSLAFHLGIPNLYLQNNGFGGTQQLFYANTFIYYEISLIPAVFAGDMVPRLFHFLMGMIFILSALDFGVDHFKIKKRNILLLTIISMPMIIFLLTVVKNDLASGLFLLLGVSCFLKKGVAPLTKYYLPAIFWGFALGVKYTNIVPLVLFLILYFLKEKRIPVKQLIIFTLIIVGILLPLMVKNYTFTGNPVFPFFHEYVDNKLPYWDASRFTLLEADAKKLFYSFKDVFKFPFTLSFSSLGSGGIVGPLFIIFLPFLVLKKEKRLLLLIFSFLILLVGANFKLSIRVWTIAFVFLSFYVAIAYEHINHRLMKYLFFIIIGFNLLTSFGLQEYLNRSYNLFSGMLGIEEYKNQTFSTYKAFAFVNEKTPKRSRVLVVGETKSFYLKRPYDVSSGYDFSILKKYLEKGSNVTEFISALQADGIDYIIFNPGEFYRLQTDYHRLTQEEYNRSLGFLKRLRWVFKEDGIYVFAIDSPPPV